VEGVFVMLAQQNYGALGANATAIVGSPVIFHCSPPPGADDT
jgi:hypothetical protein